MTYGNIVKISKAIEPDDRAVIFKRVADDLIYTLHKRSLKVIGGFRVQVSEHNEDDFVRNLMSLLIEYTAYKMPRIVKNLRLSYDKKNN